MITKKVKAIIMSLFIAILTTIILVGCNPPKTASNSLSSVLEKKNANISSDSKSMTSSNKDDSILISSTELNEIIAQTILLKWSTTIKNDVCNAQAHIILEINDVNNITTVYILEQFTRFEFDNKKFVKKSGHLKPSVMVFTRDDNGSYVLQDYKLPLQGQELEEKFTETALNKLNNITDEERDLLVEEIKQEAIRFLESLGYDKTLLY